MLKGQAKGLNTPEEFERLVAPHVKSFDYFIGEGMETACKLLEPLEVSLSRLMWVAAVWQQWQLQQQGGYMLFASTQHQQHLGESAAVFAVSSSWHSLQRVSKQGSIAAVLCRLSIL